MPAVHQDVGEQDRAEAMAGTEAAAAAEAVILHSSRSGLISKIMLILVILLSFICFQFISYF